MYLVTTSTFEGRVKLILDRSKCVSLTRNDFGQGFDDVICLMKIIFHMELIFLHLVSVICRMKIECTGLTN